MADCHRHLSGSISPESVWQMMLFTGIETELSKIREQMVFGNDETPCFHKFLSKFDIFGGMKWCTNLIRMAVQDICRQLARENTEYCLLDFSINKYVNSGWDPAEVIETIYRYFEYFRPGKVGLVLSLTYESPKNTQERYAALIHDKSIASTMVGIDLVGDEGYYDPVFYRRVLTPWRESGKMVRAHVGESQSWANIKSAILDLEVTNVAHGIKIFDDPGLIQIATNRGVTFDLALTSNYLTGVWTDKYSHPLTSMLEHGLRVTIGSDDPVVCGTDLDNEYRVAERVGASSYTQVLRQNAFDEASKWIAKSHSTANIICPTEYQLCQSSPAD